MQNTESESVGDSETEVRLRKLEADLIAQDHRAISVLQAFFRDRRTWERSDPRWKASWTAFIWWCVGGLTTPVGAAVGLAAFLTLALTGWNAWEFRRQNEALAEQNQTLQRQLDQQERQINKQEADTLIVRRAQLLAIIYEEDCTGEGEAEICGPRSHLRARQEAALAFVEIERGRGVAADLSEANLEGADLGSVNLGGARLHGANLKGSDLQYANLESASLYEANLDRTGFQYANLERAILNGAKLKGADLEFADLRSSDLERADLQEADLFGTVFYGANLKGANLTQDQINEASGDSRTTLPDDVERPDHWIDEPKPKTSQENSPD